ncbi:hypothetical protein BC826DRAFT_152809 [Russula brevipes]|nr:hypothetical protein BC826DRAFT_152809 [Russula brevipes]
MAKSSFLSNTFINRVNAASICTVTNHRNDKINLDRETLWYPNWVEPNTAYAGSVRKQKQFFIDNAALWQRAGYSKCLGIFNKACEHEMALWKAAFDHT